MTAAVTIFGWDASDYDWSRGVMDLPAARAAGIDFFTHKATEATSVRHVHYGEAMRRARDAGVPFLGAYHVVRSPANAAAEVAYCLAYANAATPWWRDFPGWFWQVDLERWPYDAVPASEGEQFADIIEQRTGKRAIIYASKGQYGNALTGTSHPLWNANYGGNQTLTLKTLYTNRGADNGPGWGAYSGVTPAIWQYGSNAIIGRQPTCDANAFRGDVAAFARLIGAAPSKPPKEEDVTTFLAKTPLASGAEAVVVSDGIHCRWVTGGPDYDFLVVRHGQPIAAPVQAVGVLVGPKPDGWVGAGYFATAVLAAAQLAELRTGLAADLALSKADLEAAAFDGAQRAEKE